MATTSRSISPLRQRMIDDMRLRKLSPETQTAYIRAVKSSARLLGRSPDSASAEDLRRYQLRLLSRGNRLLVRLLANYDLDRARSICEE